MSVNITVNGKFGKNCYHPLLQDPEEVRKSEEKERRKLRLLQVREECKKLAKKIRDEVNAEKKRELEKLQQIKEKELECWRQHALKQKYDDYRSAIFQIGTAHRAARKENEEQNAKQKPKGSYKDFQKQNPAKKFQPPRVKFTCQPHCPCQQVVPGTNKHYKCTCPQAEKEDDTKASCDEAQKRKRNYCVSSSDSESDDEGYKEQTTLPQSSLSLSSTSESSSSSLYESNKNKCLIKTPTVCLDVEVGTDDSVIISAPAEVNDKHAVYNRQFSSVIRLSPRKGQKENTCKNPSVQQSSTTTSTLSSEITATESNENKISPEKSKNNQLNTAKASKEKRFTIISDLVKKQQENVQIVNENKSEASCPSYSETTSVTATLHLSPRKQPKEVSVRPAVPRTVGQLQRKTGATSKSETRPVAIRHGSSCPPAISQLSPKKQQRDTTSRPLVARSPGQSPHKTNTASKSSESRPTEIRHGASCPPNTQTSSAVATSQLSPRKKTRDTSLRPPVARSPRQSPRKISDSSNCRTATTQPYSSFTTTAKSNNTAYTDGSSSGRVQFYDYNTKLAKNQNRAPTTASVHRQIDKSQPSAMEQAELENQRERERQLEALKKCQQMQERCEKALEREQVRRDCNELSEKLEVLTREYANHLPTNDNQHHIFPDKQLRKECKMNSAIEKLLQRPSIITCSEQNKPILDEVNSKSATTRTLLNVASLNNKPLPADDVSSDSCCSILLGYVDDQSKLIQEDLQNTDTTQNQSKQRRLKNLLQRLDQLRNSLVEELRNENESKATKREKEKSKHSTKKDNLRQAIDSISKMRKEHEEILLNNDTGEDLNSLKQREKELKAREALLDKKVRELFELQKQQNKSQKPKARKDLRQTISKEEESYKDDSSSCNEENNDLKISSNKENKICTSSEDPLEIIITVKGERKCVKIPEKPKRKTTRKKSPSKLSTLIRSPQPCPSVAKKHTPRKKTQPIKRNDVVDLLRRHNSYDSNSTSYMSLPPDLTTKLGELAAQISKERCARAENADESETANQISLTPDSEISLKHTYGPPFHNPKPYINPLIAQYINRLLGMSRNAVQNLGVSSSDIETPSSSIMNTTRNVGECDSLITDERIISINYFIEENKSFIKDLEESLKNQSHVSLERSLRMFDDIWRKRLKRENMTVEGVKSNTTQEVQQTMQNDKVRKNKKIEQKSSSKHKDKSASNDNNVKQMSKTLPSNKTQKQVEDKTTSTKKLSRDLNKSLSSHYSTADNESIALIPSKRRVETVDKAIDAKLPIDAASKGEADSQIARYAKLTENCTNRIAELTELINRVRQEKQRLLEVTLSSVSDNGRHSTEYLELPKGKSKTHSGQNDSTTVSSSSEDFTLNKQSLCTDTLQEMTKLSSNDKNKQTANSRDSGIAESRPATALENRNDQEPLSHTSENTMPQAAKKMKPPPTLKRFSPQLPEEELAHELSTIFEVDTPATSRINTGIGQSAEEKKTANNTATQQPILKFPTFEQYMRQFNLNVTEMDPDHSMKLQIEFISFLESLQLNSENSPKYMEFPSFNTYIQHLAETDPCLNETMEECLAKLCIKAISPRKFPALREYIKGKKSKSVQSDEQQLLDTESLENITCTNTDNDSASIDFEQELKKRKIIKNSFRVVEHESRRDTDVFFKENFPAESGVDKLSTSGNTSDLLDSDLKRMVNKWSVQLEKKSKTCKILSSSTTSTNPSALANSALKDASLDSSLKGCGKAFNLRDFLTRELEKRANNSSSLTNTNTSSDESLCSHFLQTLLDSLTPRTIGASSKSGGQTLERQKTSTPVQVPSSKTRSSASNHSSSPSLLFSGESRLSSVHYNDCSVRFATSEDADQSSEVQNKNDK